MSIFITDAFVAFTSHYMKQKKADKSFRQRMSEQNRLAMLVNQHLDGLFLDQLDVLHVESICDSMKVGGWVCDDKGTRAEPYSASSYNRLLWRFKEFSKWCAKAGKLPMDTYHRINLIGKAKSGRHGVKEADPVTPFPWSGVEPLREYMPPVVFELFSLQFRAGMRPGEACRFKWEDVDKTDPSVWIYSPVEHKKKKIGQIRTIYLGPIAQSILAPYEAVSRTLYLFPAEIAKIQSRQQREGFSHLKSNLDRHDMSGNLIPNTFIKDRQLRRYVETAVERARKDGVSCEVFAPNQLRHGRATEVREEYNLEAAAGYIQDTVRQAETYAERSSELAKQVARESG